MHDTIRVRVHIAGVVVTNAVRLIGGQGVLSEICAAVEGIAASTNSLFRGKGAFKPLDVV